MAKEKDAASLVSGCPLFAATELVVAIEGVRREEFALVGGQCSGDAVEAHLGVAEGGAEAFAIGGNGGDALFQFVPGIAHFDGAEERAEGLLFEAAGAAVPEKSARLLEIEHGGGVEFSLLAGDASGDGFGVGEGEIRPVAGGATDRAVGRKPLVKKQLTAEAIEVAGCQVDSSNNQERRTKLHDAGKQRGECEASGSWVEPKAYPLDINSNQLMRLCVFFLILALGPLVLSAQTDAKLSQRFDSTVKPFLASHCNGCHSGAKPAAQLNLAGYKDLSAVVQDHPHWALVAERLKAGDMPPKPLPQPDAAKSKSVIEWIETVRRNEAKKNAGDPGIVLARRLNNAEFDYAIRDLTGVDIRPSREFPVDPANPEGFDNTGESLAMSPTLLNKYLQAARMVANQMVLTPDSIAFAPHPMLVETDREKYAIQRIVNFYLSQPTDYADYFLAAWRQKHRAILGPTASSVSPKYLPLIVKALEGPAEAVGPLAHIQKLWRELPTPKKGELDLAKPQTIAMRDYVVRVRGLIAKHYASPVVKGLSTTSQPLMNWKLNEFAKNRRDFDREALLVEGEPLPVPPAAPKPGAFFVRFAGDVVAAQAKVKMVEARLADPEPLRVPAGQRERYEAAFARFADLFPDAFFISERGRFYPDLTQDQGRLLSAGFHNVMGYFRDDEPLKELILDEKQRKELDRLWLEFDFIADHTIRTYVQYFFNQSGEILGNGRESGSERPLNNEVTDEVIIMGLRDSYLRLVMQDSTNNPVALDAINAHFKKVNASIRSILKVRAESEPLHLKALTEFAARAWRRPLTKAESDDLLGYYRQMRESSGLTHEEAVRDSVVGILMSPDFSYRIDLLTNKAPVQPLNDIALASRLSFFLWASPPDQALMDLAKAGQLRQPNVLLAQTRRMLKDERARRFATEFAGHWLGFRRFEEHNAVDRERFPAFNNDLREAMFQEPIRLIDHVVRSGASVLDLLYGNYTFLNPVLAKHYGIPLEGKGWQKVDNVNQYNRGGLLPMSVFLTQNSPGLRTSPVKRGYWVVKNVLGENIPPPPASVPELPTDEAKADKPLREMLADHRNNPACAGCHARFDSFGLAFEAYGPVGEHRKLDLAGRPVDSRASFPGGMEGSGVNSIQQYIRANREPDFVNQLCRKLLAYSLGRSLLLSDEITIEKMSSRLTGSGYRFAPLVEMIVSSPQFLNKRGAPHESD